MDPLLLRFGLMCVASLACCSRASANVPVSGLYIPELQGVDALLQDFVATSAIPATNVAISRNGSVVYERGFGYSDLDQTQPIAENALMRLASVSKPITASAVHQLDRDGALDMNRRVFNLGGNGGILDIAPFGGAVGDPRLADITIADLLDHRGGWDRDLAGDLAFRDKAIADAMGLTGAPGIDKTAEYILGQPLQFSPGERRAYSNVGYMFLGMVVEEVSGQPYETYVDQNILAPAGVPAWEINAGRTLAENQEPREPHYSHDGTTTSVFDRSEVVSWPYGGWDLEKKLAYGGLIGSTKALVGIAEDRILAGPEIGKLRSDYTTFNSYWWYHTGSLAGTNTLVLQATWGEWNYAILLNRRATDGAPRVGSLVDPLNDVLGAVPSWPDPIEYLGDFTEDQWLTAEDISLFEEAILLGDTLTFEQRYPDARYLAGDFNADGRVGWEDGSGFLTELLSAGVPDDVLTLWPGLRGDYNDDGVVDARDYTVWRDRVGDPSGALLNDATNAPIGDLQYDIWAANYGATFLSGPAIVPEPSAVVVAALCAACYSASRGGRIARPDRRRSNG